MAGTSLLGAWSPFAPVNDEDKQLFKSAVRLLGVDYTPLLAAKQVVDGLQYLFVCNARIVIPNTKEYGVVVRVYLPVGEKSEVEVTRIGHPHFVGAFGAFAPVDETEKKALAEAVGVGVDWAPLYATVQIVAGRNILYAANAKVVYPDAPTYPVFVKVYQPLEGKPQLTSVTDAWDWK
ncbi:MAG: hypothetical protein LBG05_03000 [Treponema sp.]|jgi:hypothetical protein|nr:hypothetical protein [Treponema sp.]